MVGIAASVGELVRIHPPFTHSHQLLSMPSAYSMPPFATAISLPAPPAAGRPLRLMFQLPAGPGVYGAPNVHAPSAVVRLSMRMLSSGDTDWACAGDIATTADSRPMYGNFLIPVSVLLFLSGSKALDLFRHSQPPLFLKSCHLVARGSRSRSADHPPHFQCAHRGVSASASGPPTR